MNQDFCYNTTYNLLDTEQTGKNTFFSSTLLAAFRLSTASK